MLKSLAECIEATGLCNRLWPNLDLTSVSFPFLLIWFWRRDHDVSETVMKKEKKTFVKVLSPPGHHEVEVVARRLPEFSHFCLKKKKEKSLSETIWSPHLFKPPEAPLSARSVPRLAEDHLGADGVSNLGADGLQQRRRPGGAAAASSEQEAEGSRRPSFKKWWLRTFSPLVAD